MQPINVVIADVNKQKREELEYLLQQDKRNFVVLTNITTEQNAHMNERRLKSRENITLIEDSLARISRLRPRILLVGAQCSLNADCAFLTKLRQECPATLVILLVDETTENDKIMKALANGARGFLNYNADLINFSKAIVAVEQGEAWLPREMLGKIMKKILDAGHENCVEVDFDSIR